LKWPDRPAATTPPGAPRSNSDGVHVLEHGRTVCEGEPQDLAGDEYIRQVYLGVQTPVVAAATGAIARNVTRNAAIGAQSGPF
jgi:hypothetical protein